VTFSFAEGVANKVDFVINTAGLLSVRLAILLVVLIVVLYVLLSGLVRGLGEETTGIVCLGAACLE